MTQELISHIPSSPLLRHNEGLIFDRHEHNYPMHRWLVKSLARIGCLWTSLNDHAYRNSFYLLSDFFETFELQLSLIICLIVTKFTHELNYSSTQLVRQWALFVCMEKVTFRSFFCLFECTSKWKLFKKNFLNFYVHFLIAYFFLNHHSLFFFVNRNVRKNFRDQKNFRKTRL